MDSPRASLEDVALVLSLAGKAESLIEPVIGPHNSLSLAKSKPIGSILGQVEGDLGQGTGDVVRCSCVAASEVAAKVRRIAADELIFQ